MPRVDAHQHFWKYHPVRDSWITGEMDVIRKDFLPADVESLLHENNLDGCVVVQSSQSEEENTFQLKNAGEHDFIKGIAGWVDLQADNVEERLGYYSSFKKVKGFRHVLQGEAQRDLMLAPAFMNGISKLEKFGFTYDILIFPDQLQFIPEFVAAFPGQKFVMDHIAKPAIREKRMDEWRKGIETVARFENVYCKISGMVTEADWNNWEPEDFKPYLDVVVNAFGMKRIMYGSDWPVCLLAGGYEKMIGIVSNYFSSFSHDEQGLFFGENATRFYNLT
ncbi:MAG: amidohydrolase family protein [Ferruginibacter sp.]|nr:amidohydrolase family protein [Chitinophagaceae bacterium]